MDEAKQGWVSPGEALLSKAFIDGRRAGLTGVSPSLAPSQPGTPEHDQWLQGWRSGNSDRAYEDAMGRAA